MSYTTLEKIKIRLRHYEVDSAGTTVFNHDEENILLEQLIEKATQDIVSYRHYPSYYKPEQIDKDIETKYENILIELVLYDLSVEGADFENQHNENGVNRSFVKRESILAKVLPFCNVL